ncbi:CubicO group peptidase, beta-lactamase class C family [Cupriavidus sp. YR651]|uniref:serine hydrolase domain-containing protein n=1 Tax=Cupriavidus sp. YR651 TaxID=1855315 RepID=UPI000890C769|nr:serine hydrolase [Cupriavidus sp. YR651]SDC20773.1 CubicO group peptidase, beta-lactamase class C family [Cupriavidus sp. YR651]
MNDSRAFARMLLLVTASVAVSVAALFAAPARAAPDEDKLGKARGYPVGSLQTYFFDESVRVGSFSAQAEIPGIRMHELAASAAPMPLPHSASEPDIRWDVDQLRRLTVDDYLSRQRIMGLLIIKDGVIQVERYQYDRKPSQRFLSQSMAKSITSLAIGYALQEGKIASLDDNAERYDLQLSGTLYGGTSIRNLLRMASGARFTENYDGHDDAARFSAAVARHGVEAAARLITEREVPQGTRFSYSGAQTDVLAAVLRGATGMSLSEYLTTRLWQAVGAETTALWRVDPTGLEIAAGNFNATLRDYGRLGIVLANDGVRPDDPQRKAVIPRDYLLEATDWHRFPEAFQPRKATPYFGYGYQFWVYPGETRRFALLGVYGQMILVDPELKLVMVQTAANATAKAGQTTLAREADAFWRGVVRYYGNW